MPRLTIRLADRMHHALKDAAARQSRSMGSIIEESLELRGYPALRHCRGDRRQGTRGVRIER